MGKASNEFFASPWDKLRYQDDSVSMHSSTVAASEIVARRVRKFEEEEVAMTSETSQAITLQINVVHNFEHTQKTPTTDVKDREPSKPERSKKSPSSENKGHGESKSVRENSVQSSYTKNLKRDYTQETTDKKIFYYSKREVLRTQRFRRVEPTKKFECKRRLVYALLSTVIALFVIIGIWVTIYVRFNQTEDDWFEPPVATTTVISSTTVTQGPTIPSEETTTTHYSTVPPVEPSPPPTGPGEETTSATTQELELTDPTSPTSPAETTSMATTEELELTDPTAPLTTTPSSEEELATSDLPISIAFACTFIISFVVIYIWIAIYIKHKEETFFRGVSENAIASNQTNVATILSNEMYFISDLPAKLNAII